MENSWKKRHGNSSSYQIISFKSMIKTYQNIIKHPFSKCSNIKHLSNLNQQSSIPLIINQLWHIMTYYDPAHQTAASMAPAEPLPGVSSSKRRPRGLPEPMAVFRGKNLVQLFPKSKTAKKKPMTNPSQSVLGPWNPMVLGIAHFSSKP